MEINTAGCDKRPESSRHIHIHDSGESRKEATGTEMEVLNAKKRAEWNQENEDNIRDREGSTRYNLHIIGVNESTWTR